MEMRTRNRPKHYYAGSERVATRIGGGGLYAAGVDPELSDRAGKVFCQSLDQVNSRRLKENKSDCIAKGLCTHGELLCDIKDIPSRLQADTAIDYTDFRRMIHDMRAIHHDEPDVYFYHSDHLGSASWITDNGGVAVQHLQYLPYGERYVDQRVTGYQERFTFTGKERDEETGYGYFGARYMDHELTTMWLSVDPMSDKYPGISPYAYCAWNPVKLVDPDGRSISTHTDEEGNVIAVYNDGDNGVYKHNGDRVYTKNELKNKYMPSNTSAGGECKGETKYWDEFMIHDKKTGAAMPTGKIYYGESWEEVIISYNELSMQLGLEATALGSLPNGIFDIKSHETIAPSGAMTGKLLEGFYASAQSAGNFLAGLNGATSRGMFGQHISYDVYISLAGMLHAKYNKTSRAGEYKGEIPYSGRRIKEGFELGTKIREGR